MSHVADCDIQFRDLDAVAAGIKPYGGVLHRGQTHHNWYGVFLNDWQSDRAAVNRRDPKTFGKCEHAISFPGIHYEVGLCRNEDGSWTPVYDSFGASAGTHDGQLLEKLLGGAGLPKLADEYGAAVAMRIQARKGFRVARTVDKNGDILVTCTK